VRITVRLSTSREEEAEKMSIDTPNTIDPEVAEKFVSEYERNEAELVSYAAKCREGRKPFTERRASIVERATDAGLNRTAFLNEIKERAFLRKIEALKAGEDDQIAEQREMLKSALGGLPLGDWGVENITASIDAWRVGLPTSAADQGPNPMTLVEAKAILAEPKKRGRQSTDDKRRRAAAERVVAQSDGASGEKSADIAAAMDAAEEFDRFANGQNDDERDLRPRFLHDLETPPDIPAN